jgi:murein DD-endopeptidase MepM/ murein hydrolase activator NlpD
MKRIILFIFILVFIVVWTVPASADQLSSIKKEKNNVENKIDSINRQQQQEKNKLKSAISEKNSLLDTQKQESDQFKQLKQENERLSAEIDTIKNDIDNIIEKYKDQEELLKTRIRVMYERSNEGYLSTLIRSKNISDFLAKLKYISLISKRDKQLIEEINMIKTDTEFKKRAKEALLLEKKKQMEKKENKLNSLQASRADVDEQIREINIKLEKLNDQEDELIKKSGELASQIRNLQTKTKYIGGSLRWPVPSSQQISSYYGMRVHPILKKKKMHTGIDINASQGVSITAANKGTVIVAGWQSGYGYTVIIDHGGGISTLYAHCSRLLVGVGSKVNAGAVIAKVGSTGLSTGPHLHFEVRKNGATQDPLKYVSGK